MSIPLATQKMVLARSLIIRERSRETAHRERSHPRDREIELEKIRPSRGTNFWWVPWIVAEGAGGTTISGLWSDFRQNRSTTRDQSEPIFPVKVVAIPVGFQWVFSGELKDDFW